MGLSLVRKRPAPALCPSASLVSRLPAMLGLLRHGGAEQAGRPERQDEDQDHERERVAVLRAQGKVGRTQSLDDAQQQSAQEGAGDVADPTQHGGDESLEAGVEAHERPRGMIDAPVQAVSYTHLTLPTIL